MVPESWMPELEILMRVAIAAGLGGLIGLEREVAGKPAGLRTHMMVCAVAALLLSLGGGLVETYGRKPFAEIIQADPVRIIESIIVGISFLGAGTIITNRRSERVEGLTTAASILLVTAIGLSVALELYVLAVSVTLLALIILVAVRLAEWAIGVKQTKHPAKSSRDDA
jgi:putative Mg2+ transporter-C (MgtC) family protein